MSIESLVISVLGPILVGVLTLVGVLRGQKASPYNELASRVVVLENKVQTLEEERDTYKRSSEEATAKLVLEVKHVSELMSRVESLESKVKLLEDEKKNFQEMVNKLKLQLDAERLENSEFISQMLYAVKTNSPLPALPPWYSPSQTFT